MCCEPCNPDGVRAGECPDCGADIDADGDALDICGYSPDEPCETCGSNPCSDYC
jgi:hypothetical protein